MRGNLNSPSTVRRCATLGLLVALSVTVSLTTGCRAWRDWRKERREAWRQRAEHRQERKTQAAGKRTTVSPPPKHAAAPKPPEGAPIRQVVCLFDQRPWLNLDAAGDRDPEGIQFRVFLDGGAGRGVWRDGTLHVDMYQIARQESGDVERKLVSDWHYATGELTTVRAKILGDGYWVKLRWASKDVAGGEVEVIARFETPDGQAVRSATKRLRVPKYTS